jgi:hypothetical protein
MVHNIRAPCLRIKACTIESSSIRIIVETLSCLLKAFLLRHYLKASTEYSRIAAVQSLIYYTLFNDSRNI